MPTSFSVRRACASVLLLCALHLSLAAGEPPVPQTPPGLDPFRRGQMELEILAGGSSNALFGRRPDIGFAGVELRLGLMLTDRHLSGWLRGNEEIFLLVRVHGVAQGPGTYLAGGGIGLRHHFLSGNERVVPYFQGSFAVTGNDVHRDRGQSQIGGPLEFITTADFGVRIRLDARTWLRLEGGYEHISNARLYRRNDSYNGLGGKAGLSWSF